MELVRSRVPAQAIQALAEVFEIPREQLSRELRIPRATVERKLKSGGRLGAAESERVLGVTRLIGQVQQIVTESDDSEAFNPALWVAEWLKTPLAALGRAPTDGIHGHGRGP
jgi:putative toxin-antitoxin system antitoxin component (TIGR02293 family)